jgi:hypothetical protein
MLPDWGPTTFFTQGRFEPSPEEAAQLAARGVAVERTPVVELLGEGTAISALRLADGREVPAEAVFTAPRTRMTSPLAEQLTGTTFAPWATASTEAIRKASATRCTRQSAPPSSPRPRD